MKKLLVASILSLTAAPALAHTGHGLTDGFVHGLVHPVLGPDHLLAMLAVGLWSGFVLPQRLWRGAAVFLAAMLAGAALAFAGVAIGGVETMILASVFLFGALVVLSRRGQAGWITGLSFCAIGFFAASHGYAHAVEASGAVLTYLAGFVIATAALHLGGILIARLVARQIVVQRLLGGSIIASGLMLMTA